MLVLLAFRIQPEGFWLSVLLPAGEIALVAIPTCNPTLALWHFGTLALWHFGTLALWHFGTLALWHFGILALWHFGTVVAMLTLLAFRVQSEGF